MGDRLATIDMGRTEWGVVPLSGEGWVPSQYNVARAQAYLHTKWHLDPSSRLATTDVGRKLGAAAPFWGEQGPI